MSNWIETGEPEDAGWLKREDSTDDADTNNWRQVPWPRYAHDPSDKNLIYNPDGDINDLANWFDLEAGKTLAALAVPDVKVAEVVDMRGKLPATGKYQTRPIDGIVGITIHYTAGPANLGVIEIARFQLTRVADPTTGEKFPAIAYSMVIEQDGKVVLCHDLNVRCWHSGAVIGGVSRNKSHVGIVYCGDVEPNPAQIDGLKGAIAWIEAQLGRTLTVEGHRDAPYATACPGPKWPAWRVALGR